VTMLCTATYLAGVWYGTQGRMTCTVTSPGEIHCSTDDGARPPAQPEQPQSESGTA
jgi:hypothetical protein